MATLHDGRRGGAAPVLHAEGITLRFGGVTALSEVSIEVRPDEMLAIIGPNGAGKSSLLNVLSGFYRPQQGSVQYKGRDLLGRAVHDIARDGMVRTFQGTHLFANMSVLDNILVGRFSHMRSSLAAGLPLLSLDAARGSAAPRGGREHHRVPRDREHPPPAGGLARLRAAQARRPRPRAGDGAQGAADGRADGRHEHRGEGRPGPFRHRRARSASTSRWCWSSTTWAW